MKFSAFTIFAVALALVAGCKGHGLDERGYDQDAVQWGPVVNGLQVGMARRTYEPGQAPGVDQIYFVVQLRNVKGKSLSILATADGGGVLPEKRVGNESVCVTLVYDSPAGLKTAEFKPAKKPIIYEMEPGKAYSLEARLAPVKFGLDRFFPGRMTAAYSNQQASIQYDSLKGKTIDGLWTGEARSGSVIVDVRPEPQKPPAAAKPGDNAGFTR